MRQGGCRLSGGGPPAPRLTRLRVPPPGGRGTGKKHIREIAYPLSLSTSPGPSQERIPAEMGGVTRLLGSGSDGMLRIGINGVG